MLSATNSPFIDESLPLDNAGEPSSSEQPEPTELPDCERLALLVEMASSLAHELNQPLTAIRAYIDCCRHYANPPYTDKLMGVVEKIAVQARQASEIISRVRGTMRRQQPSREQVEANALVRQTLKLSGNLIHKHRASVELCQSPSLPLVETDPVQIRQVLQNLIVNSLEAVAPNSRHPAYIRISTSATPSRDVLIEVCDNGRGFSEADATRMFEPFFTTKPRGVGLGLSISQSIVRAHGGRLWATCNSQGGATFHVELPGVKESQPCNYTNPLPNQ
jgi:C4-dicarboxylate-specific signal transduction histidine kinase